MANKYYIWKDQNCNGTNPDWIEISGTQFYALGNDKTQKRYFKRIADGVEDGADVLIMETTYEEYKDWHKKQEKAVSFAPILVVSDTKGAPPVFLK